MFDLRHQPSLLFRSHSLKQSALPGALSLDNSEHLGSSICVIQTQIETRTCDELLKKERMRGYTTGLVIWETLGEEARGPQNRGLCLGIKCAQPVPTQCQHSRTNIHKIHTPKPPTTPTTNISTNPSTRNTLHRTQIVHNLQAKITEAARHLSATSTALITITTIYI
jgi:hypothetical protein